MKCPFCKYDETETADEGNFWKLTNSIELERKGEDWETTKALVRGCPNCKRLFVDDED